MITVIKSGVQAGKAVYRTKQQDLLLSYLDGTRGGHFTAEDVHAHFAAKGITIGVATIYRQLEKLVAQGRVIKYFIDERSAACFEYTGADGCPGQDEHFHLKCEVCGGLTHLACEELSLIKEHLQREHQFTLNPYRTVFYGVCAACAGAEE